MLLLHAYIHRLHGLLRQKAAKHTTKQTKHTIKHQEEHKTQKDKKYTKLNYKKTPLPQRQQTVAYLGFHKGGQSLPSLPSLPSLLCLPLPLEVGPLIAARGLGSALAPPVGPGGRPSRQTVFGAFQAKNLTSSSIDLQELFRK